MITAEVEYDELRDGSHVYYVTIYGPESEVSIPCISEQHAEYFKADFEQLLRDFAI